MLSSTCTLVVFIEVDWIWPLSSTNSPPDSLRDQYMVLGSGSGMVHGAEPGEKQSKWSRELSVITPFSLVQLDGQKVKSYSPECEKDVEPLTADCWDGNRGSVEQICCDRVGIILFGDGRKADRLYSAWNCSEVQSVSLAYVVSHTHRQSLCMSGELTGWASLFWVFFLWSDIPKVNQLRIVFLRVAVISLRGVSQIAVGDAVPWGRIWEDFLLLKPQGQHKASIKSFK